MKLNSHSVRFAVTAALGWLSALPLGAGCSKDDTTTTTATGATATGSGGATSSSQASASSTFATTAGAGGAPATFSCNPVTNEGCAMGETCDTDFKHLAFVCYAGNNSLGLCEVCGPAKAYCNAGSTCFGGKCAKYCCNDGDCGAGATCDTKALGAVGKNTVGVCRVFPESGAGGGGGAGGAAPKPPENDCKAPNAAPSLGACVPASTK